MPPRNLERHIENYVCSKIVEWGAQKGIKVVCVKLNALGNRGWPDRLFVWPNHQLMFVEFKRPGGELSALQVWTIKLLRKLGFKVEVYDDRDIAMGEIKAYILATASPIASDAEDSAGRGL